MKLTLFATTLLLSAAATALEVPVLKQSLPRGTVLTENMLTVAEISPNRASHNILLHVDEVIGLELTRPYRAQMPLYRSSVKVSPTVDKNARVMMVFDQPGLTLTAPARVLEEGMTGDIIRVLNLGSREEIYAQVKNEKTVVVQ